MQSRIDEAAAGWAVRLPLDDSRDQAAFDRWLAQDPRHDGALLRAMAALDVITRTLEPGEDGAIYTRQPIARTRRWVLAGAGSAIAATVAGVIAWPRAAEQNVTTAHGEIRRLPLADGSVATINANSDMRIVLASDNRRVDLHQGQAWFQVAKDRKRPFIVDAGVAQARAVGTAFSVNRGGDMVRVEVTEGSVAVWASEASGAMTILNQGQYAEFTRGALGPVIGTAPALIERGLAWRNGEIALENDKLSSAIDQFNRYNRQQIVLVDPTLANERLVGLFKIDRPADFAAMLRASLDIDFALAGEEIRLTRKKKRREATDI